MRLKNIWLPASYYLSLIKFFVLPILLWGGFFVLGSGETRAAAPTLFQDDFEQYNLGGIGGQGLWSGWRGSYQVVSSGCHSGNRCLTNNSVYGGSYTYKTLPALEYSGNLSFYFKLPYYDNNFGAWLLKIYDSASGQGLSSFYINRSDDSQYKIYKNTLAYVLDDSLEINQWHTFHYSWNCVDKTCAEVASVDSGTATTTIFYPTNLVRGLDKLQLSNIYDYPGYLIIDDITDEPPTPALEPVIIVPGILGSYLNRNDQAKEEVWMNLTKMAADYWDSHLNELAMESTGYPNINSPLLLPTDIFRQISDQDFFQGLIAELTDGGYEENENLFVFPYDWRWDIAWSAGNSPYALVKSLKEKVEEVKSQTGAEKVILVAHSLGGLVAKEYIKDYGQNSVSKFIDIATPHLGAPKAAKILMYGDNIDLWFLNPDTVKNITQNMPSIYQLLPSQSYFNINDPDYAHYLYDIYDLDNNGIKGGLSYEQSQEFMANAGRNNYLLSANNALHSALDNFSPKDSGIATYNIIGCGQPTIGKIYALNKEKSGGYEYALKYISGDGTVPLQSAAELASDKSYYINNAAHSLLPSAQGAKELIAALAKGEQDSFNFANFSNIKENSGSCSLSGMQVSFHSPVILHIYDEGNRHLGPNENGDIENQITGAQYDIIDNNKFAFLPEGHAYRVVGEAEDAGEFNARAQIISEGEITEEAYYNEIPLATTTVVELALNSSGVNNNINIDSNGDGVFETQISPSAVLTGNETQDFIKPTSAVQIDGELGNNNWRIATTTVSLTAEDNAGGAGILKIEYNLDNGQNWQEYGVPIILAPSGQYSVQYLAIDRAGNREEIKEENIALDLDAPEIDILQPVAGEEYSHSETLNIEFLASDALSGVASSSITVSIDGQAETRTAIDLFNYNLGEHTVAITVQDNAGNSATAEVKFIASANIGSTISDIQRSYNEGMITKQNARDTLVKQLRQIERYLEKFGVRQERRQEKLAEAMKRCIAKKGQPWCEQKLDKRFDRILYRLNKMHQRVVEQELRSMLKQLQLFYKKKWINEQGYQIIKSDLEWLMEKLEKGGEIR